MTEYSKLVRLTEEQRLLIPKQVAYWVNLVLHSGRRVEKDMIEDYIAKLYVAIGRKKPKICIFDSYTAAKKVIAPLSVGETYAESEADPRIMSQINSQAEAQALSRASPQDGYRLFWETEKFFKEQIMNQVYLQIRSQVAPRIMTNVKHRTLSQVWSAICTEVTSKIWSDLRTQIERRYGWTDPNGGLGVLAAELAYYDYFEQIGVVSHRLFAEWRDYLKFGIWCADYLSAYVVISRLPTKVIKDQDGHLHSLTEPAVQWADHLDNYFIHGVRFTQNVWNAIAKKTISARQAISLPSAEQRAIACQAIGYDTVLAELHAKTIDKEISHLPNGKDLHYQLFSIQLHDDRDRPAKFIKVECPSTGKATLLRVHPNIRKVRTALAWTFGIEPETYVLDTET
jgi:hypothetical protein